MNAIAEINPPHPSLIINRFVAATGYTEFLPQNFGPFVATDYLLQTESADTLNLLVQGAGSRGVVAMGRFDPVIQDWRFPPELVEPDERQTMARVGQNLYEQTRPFIHSETMVDAQHPVTVQARQKIAAVLAPLKPLAWLSRDGVDRQLLGPDDGGSSVLGADEYTTTFATVNNAIYNRSGLEQSAGRAGQFVIENGMLALSYAGVQVESGRPGGVARSVRSIVLARRSPIQSNMWFPNKDAITQKEWEALHVIPEMLGSLAVTDPRFSLRHCALVYNHRRGE